MDAERRPRVLVVEDEDAIREGLLDLLGQSGFEVDASADGHDALQRLEDGRYDLVLLDLMIPGVVGLEVLRRTRARGDTTPVLVLTAKGAEDDVVAGIEAGADDYVTKPFGIRELVARARGLLRRPQKTTNTTLCVDEVTIDFDALVVSWPSGTLRLTDREGSLVQYLVENRERPVSREELLVEVWGYRDGTIRTRTVDVHVQQLRAKLRDVPTASDWIQTIRGRGYRFEVT